MFDLQRAAGGWIRCMLSYTFIFLSTKDVQKMKIILSRSCGQHEQMKEWESAYILLHVHSNE